jgi:hypothetical protein
MTNLLELPIKIFKMITHELVSSTTGVSSDYSRFVLVWKLRVVCRTFAAEIERDVFSQQQREFYRSCYRIECLIIKYLSRYMTQVSRVVGNVNQGFCARLQRMTSYLLEKIDIKDEKQRTDTIDKFYLGLVKLIPHWQLAHVLWSDCSSQCYCVPQDQNNTGLPVLDRLYAALVAGAHKLLADVLPELTGVETDPLFEVPPFQIARELDDSKSIGVIIHHLEQRPSWEQADLTNDGKMFCIQDTINVTLSRDSGTTSQLLLDYHKDNLPPPSREVYNRWVCNSLNICTTKYLHNLNTVLDFNAGGKTRVLRDTMLIVFARGSSEDVQEVLKRFEDVDKGTAWNAPIFMAVRSGRKAAVQGCIQAGANVNLVVRSNIPSLYQTHIIPIVVAMYRNEGSVTDVLIQAGATIPHISQWPSTRRVYKVLHEAASKRTSVDLPDLYAFRHMSQAKLRALHY